MAFDTSCSWRWPPPALTALHPNAAFLSRNRQVISAILRDLLVVVRIGVHLFVVMQPSEGAVSLTGQLQHSNAAVSQPSDILLEIPQEINDAHLSSDLCNRTRSVSVDVSWIRLRDQRFFCGWIWGAGVSSSLQSHTSSTKAVRAANQPVTVNDLAGNFAAACFFFTRLKCVQLTLAPRHCCKPRSLSRRQTSRGCSTACRSCDRKRRVRCN
jgi:hypothetical protein